MRLAVLRRVRTRMETNGVRRSPRRKGKAKSCGKRVSTTPEMMKKSETNPSGKELQSGRIATLMLKKFGIPVLTMIGNSKEFISVDAHTMRLDNVPLVLPSSICSGVRPADVGTAVAEKIGYDVASAILWSSNPDLFLSQVLRQFHILPPTLCATPRIGHSEVALFWADMYGSILNKVKSYGTLEKIFSTKLVFPQQDRNILVDLFDTFGIIVAEPFKKGGVKIMIGKSSIAVSERDYGFLQTFFLVDNWGTLDGGTMEKARQWIK